MAITFPVKYELGHSYDETWQPSDYFCPFCGENEHTWDDFGSGDDSVGSPTLCLQCKVLFWIPLSRKVVGDWQDEQRIAAISNSLLNPVTPREES